jgi:hypothetical protein
MFLFLTLLLNIYNLVDKCFLDPCPYEGIKGASNLKAKINENDIGLNLWFYELDSNKFENIKMGD